MIDPAGMPVQGGSVRSEKFCFTKSKEKMQNENTKLIYCH